MQFVSFLVIAVAMLQSRHWSVIACDQHDHHHVASNTTTTTRSQHLRSAERYLEDYDSTEECGFQEPSAQEIAKDATNMRLWKRSRNFFQRTTTTTYAIPVYFHIIQPTFATGLVGGDRITQYIDYLNDSFTESSAPFFFRYVNTSRTIHPVWADDCANRNIEFAFKSLLKVGGSDTLNVYICNNVLKSNGVKLAGYTYVPSPYSDSDVKDGIVLSRSTSDRRLNTLVHEAVSGFVCEWLDC